ncbi:hypothetical protein GLOIN_2v1632452 [Rhizophagus clarus]|nr:hypothetical protein GLOIN_2v1632452 [Rhizophagus clarus]
MLEHLVTIREKRSKEMGIQLPKISRSSLTRRTQRSMKLVRIIEKIGIDKIKYLSEYSPNSISELTNDQIQEIIVNFSKNPNTELPDGQEGSIIDSEEEISDDQNNALEVLSLAKVTSTAPIPLAHIPNSSDDTSSSKKLDTKVEVVPPIPQPNNPTHVQARNKVLKLYPDISFHSKPSDESEDVYRCRTKSSICPLCKTNHKENIVGRYWEGSYLLSCMYKMKGLEVVVPFSEIWSALRKDQLDMGSSIGLTITWHRSRYSEIEQSEPEMMCTICFDEFNQAQAYTKFACGHTFHFKCAIEYLIHGITNIHEIFLPRKLCPNCQAIIIYEAPPPEHIRPSNRGGNLHPGRGQYNVVPQPKSFPIIPGSFRTSGE